MKKTGIYGLRNVITGLWYIGQSIDCRHRIAQHFCNLKARRHPNDYLQKSFLKHGADSFEWHILEIVNEEMLDVREKAWISYYRSHERFTGYNLDEGGQRQRRMTEETKKKIGDRHRGRKGHSPSAAHRAAIIAAHTGTHHTEATKEKLRRANLGKKRGPISDELRAKLSALAKGRVISTETRRKLSEALKGRPLSKETRRKMSIAHKKRRIEQQ